MSWWRMLSPEQREEWRVRTAAGKLLCVYAGLPYKWSTAQSVATAIKYSRWYELSPEATTRLKARPQLELDALVSDILD